LRLLERLVLRGDALVVARDRLAADVRGVRRIANHEHDVGLAVVEHLELLGVQSSGWYCGSNGSRAAGLKPALA
jgi:hypothetical protein